MFDLLKSVPGREVVEDPRYAQGFRDGRDGKPMDDSSEPYKIGYEQGRELLALRGREGMSECRCSFCGQQFETAHELWSHCQVEHDPDGIAYTDFGPK